MMEILTKFLNWWNRPPAEDRILDAMSFTEWRGILTIADAADVSLAVFWITTEQLVRERVIQKRRRGMMTVFRKLKSGKRRPAEQSANAEPQFVTLATL